MTPEAPGRNAGPSGGRAVCGQGYFRHTRPQARSRNGYLRGKNGRRRRRLRGAPEERGRNRPRQGGDDAFRAGRSLHHPQPLERRAQPGRVEQRLRRGRGRGHGSRRVRQPDDGLHASPRRVLRRAGLSSPPTGAFPERALSTYRGISIIWESSRARSRTSPKILEVAGGPDGADHSRRERPRRPPRTRRPGNRRKSRI